MNGSAKRILIIAGPNGAGKTTFAREFLPSEANVPTFINADLIAAGLNPFQPENEAMRAGRLMLQMIDERVRAGDSFAFETTLSGRSYAQSIPQWRRRDTGWSCITCGCRPLTWRLTGCGGVFVRAATTSPKKSFAAGSSSAGTISCPYTGILSMRGSCTIIQELPPCFSTARSRP